MHRHYQLVCTYCQTHYTDDGFMLDCKVAHEPALLQTKYENRCLEIDTNAEGICQYRCWLPICRAPGKTGKTVIYQSEFLSRLTGLSHLWIAFNGYWPERGADLETATFKELEALTVLSRLPETHRQDEVLVVSSAGNTAAAFARVCAQNEVRCLIIMPESGLKRLQFTTSLAPFVRIVTLVHSHQR